MVHFIVHAVGNEAHSHLWDVAPSLLGAVVGGVISTATAFLVAKQTQRKVLEKERDTEAKLERAVGQSAWLKLKEIADRLHTLNKQVQEMLGPDAGRVIESDLWKRLFPLAGVTLAPISFSAQEIALVFKAGQSAIANDMMLIASRGAAADAIVLEYSDRRRVFAEMLVKYDLLEEAEGPRMTPIRGELEQAAPQIWRALAGDRELAVAAIQNFSREMSVYFRDPNAFRFVAHPPI